MSNPQVTFANTTFDGPSLLRNRKTIINKVTVKAQLRQLTDTGRYSCFNLKWHPTYDDHSSWPVPKSLFWESDVGKWIEGACYSLAEEYDAEIDAAVQEMVSMIRDAQQQDGYLNVYFTVVEPDKRWSNIRDQHELYNAGHLIEGALAHNLYYKNTLFLEPMEKFVRLIRSVFGPGKDQRHGYPGHPEIELALLRLYTATGNQDAYDLAQYFMEERGNPIGQDGMFYYAWEERQRGDSPYKRPNPYPVNPSDWYNQAHAPILEQKTVEGHAVRAMYLYTAVADLLCLDRFGFRPFDKTDDYFQTLNTLWDNMVDKRMYITGGIGAMHQWEGFGLDYYLPQSTDEGGCYSETCASIGVMMLAERLLHLDLNSRYADIMELQLYNAVMTAMSMDGEAFTYINQLGSSEQDKSIRETWFECSCCPPNLMRLYGTLGGYLWDHGSASDGAFINVHLYTTAKLNFDIDGKTISITQRSNWPLEGEVSIELDSTMPVVIRLRIPAWSRGDYTLKPDLPSSKNENGYVVLPSSYTSNNPSFVFRVNGFQPRLISPHPYTNQRTLTLARGPIVYCVEDVDNSWENNHFKDVVISADSQIQEEERQLEGERYIALRSRGWIRDVGSWTEKGAGLEPGATSTILPLGEDKALIFIPYYLRANRGGKGHMRVGLLQKH